MGERLMVINHHSVLSALERAIGREIQLDPDISLLESSLIIDSLTMLKLLAELEKISGVDIPPEDAFELFGSSLNQITKRLSELAAQVDSKTSLWVSEF